MAVLIPASAEDRSDAAAFAGRVARWSPDAPVRLVAGSGSVGLWAGTPFEVLATRSVLGRMHPDTATVRATDLLAGLAVSTAADVDPGRDLAGQWRWQLPPSDGWTQVADVPAVRIADLVRSGAETARAAANAPRQAHRSAPVPAGLLDSPALTLAEDGPEVRVPMRMLFALSGMGFAGDGPDEPVRVRATRSWLRLDARYGAVIRRRIAMLPLLV